MKKGKKGNPHSHDPLKQQQPDKNLSGITLPTKNKEKNHRRPEREKMKRTGEIKMQERPERTEQPAAGTRNPQKVVNDAHS
jgi:hypothetical protein